MEKRTWAYIQSPFMHEIAPCSCGNEKTQWSEYAKHLWCSKCEKDFIPEHNGIFDGPIAFHAARMLGLTFDRVNLLTGKVEVVDANESANGPIRYVECFNTEEVFANKKVEVDIKHYPFHTWNVPKEEKIAIKKGILSFDNGSFNLELSEKMEQCEKNDFMLTIAFDYPPTVFDLALKINEDLKTFSFLKSELLKEFEQFVMVHELNNDLTTNNPPKKVGKI
jgi:hypothetical protein